MILLLGKGIANNGCKRLLDKYQIKYDYFNISELETYQYEYIVKSPGISLSDEIFKKLNGKIISDIELGYMITHPNIIGITGSNGKTTVSSMLDYILKNKYNVCLCGNIGYSFCDALVDKPGCDYYIVEMSSFQLEATYELDCVVSAILNVSMCHIDHHKSFEKYLEAKTKITSNQSFNNFVVYNLDDPYLKDIKRKTKYNEHIFFIIIILSFLFFYYFMQLINLHSDIKQIHQMFQIHMLLLFHLHKLLLML